MSWSFRNCSSIYHNVVSEHGGSGLSPLSQRGENAVLQKGKYVTIMILILSLCICPPGSVAVFAAERTPDDIRELLSKGLTIYEIDQEVMRLTERETALTLQIEQVSEQTVHQELLLDAQREHAGKVLRSYYKGHRDNLWMLLFHADSFYEALHIYQYLSYIYKQDRRILQEYADTFEQLKQLLEQLQKTRSELTAVKTEFLAQRRRLVSLQEELERELAEREDAAAILEEIDALTRVWETKGMPVFRHYFQQLAIAIQGLPDEIMKKGNLNFVNGKFRMTISDEELTNFMREQNPDDFANFSFSFADQDLTAYGTKEDTAISIKGYYELVEDENVIAFHLTKLVYNGFELPDTTIRDMNESFDLNVYPDLLELPFKIKTTDVFIEDRELIIDFVLVR